jgi:acetylornithine deacetylase/succinyl-diaminopimelate desuccinylase-like protein
MKTSFLSFLICIWCGESIVAQSPEVLTIRQSRIQNTAAMLQEYTALLSIPNVASDTINIQKNAAFIMNMMNKRGIQNVQLLNAVDPGVPPAVYGEVLVPGAKQTLVFYAHYDGQPVNPAQWAKGLEPFTPKLFTAGIDKAGDSISFPANGIYQPEWRIYARGASDDKAGVFAILNAYSSITAGGQHPGFNLKFFFEGEEEAGSPHLHEILEKHASLLRADLWIICDGPVHQTGKKQVVFGVRGDAHLDLTVYAAKRPLHSGHYGNWSPNPAMMLAKLLASMKDDKGKVTVKGFL